uniref:Uncharacterized protein n=1 Tax=Glossina pallidipes TaxID=7398 RepID=A0A1A9ZBS4_GLOPL
MQHKHKLNIVKTLFRCFKNNGREIDAKSVKLVGAGKNVPAIVSSQPWRLCECQQYSMDVQSDLCLHFYPDYRQCIVTIFTKQFKIIAITGSGYEKVMPISKLDLLPSVNMLMSEIFSFLPQFFGLANNLTATEQLQQKHYCNICIHICHLRPVITFNKDVHADDSDDGDENTGQT